MARREYSEAYILSTPEAKREFEGRDEYGRVFGPAHDYCPTCGATATDGRGNEAEARSLADIRHWEARLCLLECRCGARYHYYA